MREEVNLVTGLGLLCLARLMGFDATLSPLYNMTLFMMLDMNQQAHTDVGGGHLTDTCHSMFSASENTKHEDHKLTKESPQEPALQNNVRRK